HDEIITKAEKNIYELQRVIKGLASVDPETIELKELNRNFSVIKINELRRTQDGLSQAID
ncbi:MAG: hypothetical protein AB1775_02220, partial [Bacteroidota bacterium]